MARVLVDGDPIVYACGFAAQRSTYLCTFENAAGALYTQSFGSRTDRNEHRDRTKHELVDCEERVIAEPVDHALSTVRRSLEVIAHDTGSRNLEIFLTAPAGASFRHLLAKQKPYKGNRKAPRPAHYDAIRAYLEGKHGAVVVLEREADDELSIQAALSRSRGEHYVIATIDKDLDQIPGTHYDYRQHVGYEVDDFDAARWFWIQVVAGDATDNVPGCWKVGRTKAEDIVDGLMDDDASDELIWDAIVDVYATSQSTKGCPYLDRPAEHVALETAQLVYLQKTPGELWSPPGTPRGRVEDLTSEQLRSAA